MQHSTPHAVIAGIAASLLLVTSTGHGLAWADDNDDAAPGTVINEPGAETNPMPTPGFPLGGKYNYPAKGSDFNDSTPAPYTVINYGGIPHKGPNFVNIGDSHTVTAWLPSTVPGDPCMHNEFGFAQVVGQKTGLPVRDASCAGAAIEEYWHTGSTFVGKIPKAAQRLAINKNTTLVVASLGGNDTYLDTAAELMTKCAKRWKKGDACSPYLAPSMMGRARVLSPAIYYMLKDIKARAASDAIIIAMGYYSPFPKNFDGCPAEKIVPKGDIVFFREFVEELNHQMQLAARKAGVIFYNPSQYIDFNTSSCGAPFQRYIVTAGAPEINMPIHPTLFGHWKSADTVVNLYNQELQARKAGKSIAPATWTIPYGVRG
ncbi:GDSL-type esterase/lipase family protein [Lawsonella clevelandensis]|uniref:GDSL-type esterase/lipase family protein n=1 Tax=Lawsonella clevelandensis TaxID=1528099 RepID=UPI0023F42120|nr:GDSL-type esterase/lipase family protein [Lawsonella clevelandensis]